MARLELVGSQNQMALLESAEPSIRATMRTWIEEGIYKRLYSVKRKLDDLST